VTTGGQCCRLQSDVNAYTTSAISSSTKFPYQPTTTLLVFFVPLVSTIVRSWISTRFCHRCDPFRVVFAL